MAALPINKRQAQRRLAIIWMACTALLLLIIIGQTMIGSKLAKDSDAAWDWFIPQVFPILMLMVGVLVASAQASANQDVLIERSYYYLTLGVLLFYFAVLILVMLTAPYDYVVNGTPALVHLQKASKILGALQGAATLILGIFFVREAKG